MKLAVFHSIFNTIGIAVMMPFTNQLVNFLMRVMPDKKLTTAEPKHLNDSVIELPDTALEAVRKETLHLYDNAFTIIAHGLSLHRHDILSEKDLEDVVKKDSKVMPIDIDEEYNQNVKGLYSAIVNFISRANLNMTPGQTDELFRLRAAGRDIVEAIKDTKHMHKNLKEHIVSDNDDIRASTTRSGYSSARCCADWERRATSPMIRLLCCRWMRSGCRWRRATVPRTAFWRC